MLFLPGGTEAASLKELGLVAVSGLQLPRGDRRSLFSLDEPWSNDGGGLTTETSLKRVRGPWSSENIFSKLGKKDRS